MCASQPVVALKLCRSVALSACVRQEVMGTGSDGHSLLPPAVASKSGLKPCWELLMALWDICV